MMTTAAMVRTIVLEMTMRALKPPLSTLTKAIKTTMKTAIKTKTTKLLECADPSVRTKGKQIGYPTTTYLCQQDGKQERVCTKPPFKLASCSSQPQT
jgi:hypothetical protein